MHFFKTISQILTMFAVGTMALPTPCNIATAHNTGDIVARSDTLYNANVEASTGAKDKQKRQVTEWYCTTCHNTFYKFSDFRRHNKTCGKSK
ncbi:hypothetical protein PgNI_10843 [Pyricularia grisea]|uniref:C2H2-type domain-containing protein n=1 Tax=Pyricularia grisea TaxID=148305 RepID=A0A6P8AYY6_PYRGI|nr:hypothetical protein PgNI_10843 [Pyricularia grisea]TLD07461.1 hypothetical protein PgNI_10843 [Pyricularia grisea]